MTHTRDFGREKICNQNATLLIGTTKMYEDLKLGR